jgi:uncharacterized protein
MHAFRRIPMTLKTLFAVPALAVMLATTPLAAQDAQQKSLAKEMLVAMKAADNFDAVIPTVMQALKPVVTRGDAKIAKDWDDISPIVAKEMASAKDALLDEIAGIYAKSFTAAELKQFVDFYRTPAGVKLAAATPAIAQQTMAAGQRFGGQIAGRLGERMKEELRKRGNNI